jgi:hypothetical protein
MNWAVMTPEQIIAVSTAGSSGCLGEEEGIKTVANVEGSLVLDRTQSHAGSSYHPHGETAGFAIARGGSE